MTPVDRRADRLNGSEPDRRPARLVATLAAIVWANVSLASYEMFWETHLMVGVGDLRLDFTLHALVNDALLFVLITKCSGNEHAWGVVISTDTAFRPAAAAACATAFVLATIIFRISDAVRPCDDSGQTLARPVDPARDHVLGDPDAPYTIVEYGDLQCGFCLKASGSSLEVRDELGDRLRYVWRHAPLVQIHPNALAGAEASEAAAAQGRFSDFARAIFDD